MPARVWVASGDPRGVGEHQGIGPSEGVGCIGVWKGV